jgi:predicted transcriptional regulator
MCGAFQGVLGHITVRTTVLSKSALLGAKDESKKRKKKAKQAAADAEHAWDGEGGEGGDGGAGFSTRQALASILPRSWVDDPAVVRQVAEEAADKLLDAACEWMIRAAAGQAFEHQKVLRLASSRQAHPRVRSFLPARARALAGYHDFSPLTSLSST